MAVTIGRTPQIDDDGSGGTGTPWNNAWKQELYNQIDAALAAAAAAAFGPIQTITTTGTQNDFALTAGATELRCNNASLLTFTGLAAGFDGQRLTISSVGAGQVDIKNQDAGSSAANRVNVGVAGTISLAAGVGRATLVYDATAIRWRVLLHEQGAWITPPYAAGDFTALSGTWTVDAGDVTLFRYYLKGRCLTVNFYLVTTSVSAAMNTLYIKLPAGLTAAISFYISNLMYNDAAWASGGVLSIVATDTRIALQKKDLGSANWSITTNLTYVSGSITLEVL